jgi:hypothetical protein
VEFELDRYTAHLSRPELLKAIRALSWRYVEARGRPGRPAALDTAGKRAAFAAFYAPLHYLTVRAIVDSLGRPAPSGGRIVDLGCGTGMTSAAWALAVPPPVSIEGVDLHPWAVSEANWTWQSLGIRGRARRGDFVAHLERLAKRELGKPTPLPSLALGWSVNELDARDRERARKALVEWLTRGASALVIEPLARAITPWWDEWAAIFTRTGGRADEWSFETALPATLADLNEAAGFSARRLTARTLFRGPA